MKFLVIGASGFIGSHILAHIKALGYEALGTQSKSKDTQLITFDLLQYRIYDCVDESFFKKDKPIFGVICACISQIDRCFRERKISYIVNVKNTIRLIEDLADRGVTSVFLSSGSVYDGNKGYYDEDYPHSPICEYGRHKAAVEDFIREKMPSAIVLRLDKIVGDEPGENHLFTEWNQYLNNNRPITCIQGQLFSPTFVEDVAQAAILGCQRGLSGFYNVANPEFFTREELARQFVFTLGKKCDIISKPQTEFKFQDSRPLKSYLDSTKFMKATGFRFTSMREVFNSFIRKLKCSDLRETSCGGYNKSGKRD